MDENATGRGDEERRRLGEDFDLLGLSEGWSTHSPLPRFTEFFRVPITIVLFQLDTRASGRFLIGGLIIECTVEHAGQCVGIKNDDVLLIKGAKVMRTL